MDTTVKTSPPQKLDKLSQEFGARTGEMAHNFTDKAANYVQTSRDYVKQNPVRSIGMAAAAGLITGSLLTMAARRRDH